MERKLKVLIADESVTTTSVLKERLTQMGMDVVCTVKDGFNLPATIKHMEPDVVLIDLWLPKCETVHAIKETKALFASSLNAPTFIVLSTCSNQELFVEAIDAGATYCMYKPVNYSLLEERLGKLQKRYCGSSFMDSPKTDDMEMQVTAALKKIGIPAHIKGYQYLRLAILTVLSDPGILAIGTTKALYPFVADKFQTTPSRVERAIRHAIEVAYGNGNTREMSEYLSRNASEDGYKPTNSELIASIADALRLQNKC